ncbi:39S ribosomal protein L51, mitochondrial-like [Penaeus chinensis]|uniref:39S ribosomal protein L51, mitochondrial-like n=1 Tax=Penaeus chinensis TaxID=139456 RepID=UPI001FB723B6|nr:39S ribosomal protein L51, mitochondrial-like [Penaeus chinensis]
MTTVAGSLMRSLGAVAQSMVHASPMALRGVSQGLAARATPASATWTPQVTSVRHRYHADKLKRGPVMKNYGYEDRLHTKGKFVCFAECRFQDFIFIFTFCVIALSTVVLPMVIWLTGVRCQSGSLFKVSEVDDFSPANPSPPLSYSTDILGDGSLKPTDVSYSVQHWLRGFKGNEYQMLLRKRKFFHAQMGQYQPTKLTELNKRIRKLYVHLNQKTKDYYWHKA